MAASHALQGTLPAALPVTGGEAERGSGWHGLNPGVQGALPLVTSCAGPSRRVDGTRDATSIASVGSVIESSQVQLDRAAM